MNDTDRAASSARHSRESGTSAKRAGRPKAGPQGTSEASNPVPSSNEEDWQTREFVQALSSEKSPRRGKLQARNYQSSGKFPVIDQGQSEVAGWIDDESLVIDSGLPYIVFGDHTRAFKYVDKPFVLGADGTQLLKPSTEYCPRFFYYSCLHLDLPSRGYNRHYTFLKAKSLPLPSKPEQEKIAVVLWTLQRAIAIQDRLIAATRDLKQSAMQRLFTHGVRGERLRDTGIGRVPASWQIVTLDQVANVRAGHPFPHRYQGRTAGDLPFYKVSDMNAEGNERELGMAAANWIKNDALKELKAKTLSAGTTVFPKVGGALLTNKKRLLSRESVVDNNIMGVWPKNSAHVRHDYLFAWFESIDLAAMANPGPLPSLNAGRLNEEKLPMPCMDEQRDIAAALATIDRKLAHHQRKRASLGALFQTTLHQLMTAQLRVADLDIDTSEVTTPIAQGEAA